MFTSTDQSDARTEVNIKKSRTFNETPSQSYRASLGSHSVTCHLTQVNTTRLNPSQTGWYSITEGEAD